ncbi:AAA family ATPase [Glycomyces mayteni]|uniref:AAA family ATPase n=1 Tax=Glycomyces mayteni TaxID=543887 RepID=A0ABW2D202_9ACTN|nr:tetratricopeptide repeat protein [Glycomyces mayteni]
MDDAAPTLQDILRHRQQDDFVGREARLAEFRGNLHLPPADPARRYIVNVHGIAGVGKSFLLQQFRRIAQAEGAACAYADEEYFEVVETMSAVAADLAAQDARLTEFEARLATYRQRRTELEGDPNAPLGDMLTASTVRAGMALAKSVPVAGAITEFVDADALASQANRFRAYLVQKFGKKADIDLLLSPVDVLSRAFVQSLNDIAAQRPVVLCFDTFERTAPYLEDWLLNLFSGKFGGLSAKVVTVVAGQLALADNRWSPLRSLIASFPLEPFTEEEARALLAQRGVSDESVVAVILSLSGRIPMWLATLAENSPQEPGAVLDPTEDAVKRFLKWEPDEDRRRLAEAAALPRRFNRDLLPAEHADLFDWLRRLPFVSRTGDYWRYHDAVRDPMLRSARIASPQRWRERHQALADHFADERDALGIAVDQRWDDEQWRALYLEEAYHRLCAAPASTLPEVLARVASAADTSTVLARRWAAMLTEAGKATDTERLKSWGPRLTELLKDESDDTAFLTSLIDSGDLDPDSLRLALVNRAWSHRTHARYEESLADWNRLIELDPERAAHYTDRGVVLQLMERYEEAVADFDRARSLAPEDDRNVAQRGFTFHLQGLQEKALAELDRAIGMSPDEGWSYVLRAWVHDERGDEDAALADYGRAIELIPDDSTPYAFRGSMHRSAGRLEEALTDLGRAIALDADYEWALERHSDTLFDLRRYDLLVPDAERLIGLGVDSEWVYVRRVMGYLASGDAAAALAETARMTAESPADGTLRSLHGLALMSAGRRDEAHREFLAAIDPLRSEPDPDPIESGFGRVVDLLLLDRSEEARELLGATLRLQPDADAMEGFMSDLDFLIACPGIEVAGVEESRSVAAEYKDRLPEAG